LNQALLFLSNHPNVQSESAQPKVNEQSARLSFFFVVLFTIAIYARPEDIFPVLAQLHLTFVLGLCAGLAYLGSYLLGNVRLTWTRELQIVLLLTGCFVAGVPFAYWRGGSFQLLTQVWLKTLIVFFLLTQTLVSVDRIRKILWAIILSELVVCAYSIVQSSHAVWVDQRLSGVSLGILGWNFLGLAAALTIPYIAAIYILQPGFFKTSLLISSVLFLLWMLVLTASRSGSLNVLFSIALTCLFVLGGTTRGKLIGVAIVLIAVVAIGLAPGVFWQRMATIWSSSENSQNEVAASAVMSEQERLGVLERAIHYSLENPLLGLGLGNFQVASGTETGKPEAWLGAHNTFVEISSEAGIPALLLFAALLWTAIQRMHMLGKKPITGSYGLELKLMARATLVSLLSFIFGAFFAHIGYEYFLYYPVAFAVGIQNIALSIEAPRDFAIRNLTSELQTSAMNWGS
jgi:putative inorganic carbon (hco3(-)) transporter